MFTQSSLVHPKEKIYFGISMVISLLLYLVLIVSIVGIVIVVVYAIVIFVIHGLLIGTLRGNGIRISEKQFPEIYRLVQHLANHMEIAPVPAVYILESGGLLNAFATRFLRRDFVVIYSDILELAYENGESAVAFVICHELAHIKCKHLTWRRWLLYPSMLIPFLGTAYSRACEYTCDRFGAYYQPEGAILGLLALSTGKKLYGNVNIEKFANQVEEERSFWIWLSEILSPHPNLSKRVYVLVKTNQAIHPAPSYITEKQESKGG